MKYIMPKGLYNPAQEEAAEEVNSTIATIDNILLTYGVRGNVRKFANGARITRFYIQLAPGEKYNKLKSLKDILAATFGKIAFVDPSQNDERAMGLFGIDIPKRSASTVCFGNFRAEWKGTSYAAFALGSTPTGKGIVCDLAKMPHLLIAGASGSGKSVCINAIISSILTRQCPEACQMILIDPKQVELSVYEGLPHLYRPIAKNVTEAIEALRAAEKAMDSRYSRFKEVGVRSIEEYNAKFPNAKKGRIVVIIDELADLMLSAKYQVEPLIIRLAQLARAAGIHLVVATQEPTCAVISGLIKANMPSRIAFATATSKESVVILGHGGAEKLLGKGDMLYKSSEEIAPVRLQGVYVSREEIERLVTFIKNQNYIPFSA